jgi:predicted metal-dependent hydrolase
MKKEIVLHNRKITYTLRKSRRTRRVLLAVHRDKGIVVTMPMYFQEKIVERFMQEKSKWLFSKIAYIRQFKGRPAIRLSRRDYKKYKETARELVNERINHFNVTYKCSFNKVSVKNQKTRWGSCSKKGNLNFNYRIIFLPEKARDYIIVHELCHLKEFNHSKKFWSLVAKTFPDYREIRSELRKQSMNLQ